MADQKKGPGAKSPERKARVAKAPGRTASSEARVAARALAIEPNEDRAAETRKPRASRPRTAGAGPASNGAEPRVPGPLFDIQALMSVSRGPAAQAVETAVAATAKAFSSPSAETVVAPAKHLIEIGTEQVRQAYANVQATGASFRQAMAETANATTRGALEVNGKVIEALRAQSDAAFDVWRSALTAGSFSEAVQLQASGARQVYETAAAHWKDVADTTRRWLGTTVRPFQAPWIDRSR
jgi:hypothetical protein